MRLLSITHSYGDEGASLMLRHAARHWVQALGWQVDALVDDNTGPRYADTLAECGMRPVRQVRFADYDMALINTLLDMHFIEQVPRQVPVALWVHEGEAGLLSLKPGPRKLSEAFLRLALLVFQTDWQRLDLYRSFTWRVPRERVAVIPNGVQPADAASLRPWGWSPGPKVRILQVGTVTARKRQGDLAQVVMQLARSLPVECAMVGNLRHSGSLGPQVMALIRQPPPCLRWTGPVPHAQLEPLIGTADLFCQPSDDESFALAPLEAAARRVPVILSELPSYGQIGWRHGINCLMHPVGDLARLEACIRQLMQDPALYRRLQEGGAELAQSLPLQACLDDLTVRLQQAPASVAPPR